MSTPLPCWLPSTQPVIFLPMLCPPAGEYRLLLQLRQRGPGRVPVRGVQGALQLPTRAELGVQPQNQGEPPASASLPHSCLPPLHLAIPASFSLLLHTHHHPVTANAIHPIPPMVPSAHCGYPGPGGGRSEMGSGPFLGHSRRGPRCRLKGAPETRSLGMVCCVLHDLGQALALSAPLSCSLKAEGRPRPLCGTVKLRTSGIQMASLFPRGW